MLPRLALMTLAALSLGACSTGAFLDSITTTAPAPQPEAHAGAHVYIFRGVGGRIASLDLDHLGEKIKAKGIDAEVYNFTGWWDAADKAVKRYKAEANPAPIILVGHSAGGDATLSFAERLKEERIPVNLVITFDPTRRAGRVPSNIDRYINIYGSMNLFGGGDVKPASDFRGHFATVDLKQYWTVLHVNMIKISGLQDRVIAKVVQAATTPVSLEGTTVPIRYVMPRNEPIELWDSGMPVQAEAGDSVAGLAAHYGVPAWAVAQINSLDPAAKLTPGQRVVLPRNLGPMAPLSAPLTSFAAPTP